MAASSASTKRRIQLDLADGQPAEPGNEPIDAAGVAAELAVDGCGAVGGPAAPLGAAWSRGRASDTRSVVTKVTGTPRWLYVAL